VIRKRELSYAEIIYDNGLQVIVPEPPEERGWYRYSSMSSIEAARRITVAGADARVLAARAMVKMNGGHAKRSHVEDAVDLLQRAGSAEEYVRQLASEGVGVTRGGRLDLGTRRPPPRYRSTFNLFASRYGDTEELGRARAIALEMALHEESERRALEGELSLLEDAWREAEEIAAIADALPDDRP
jgi:hypothetical protein